ncbi:aldo/keto reductase [Hymenobacter sp. PAMC 26628]|uniref:aldo/keto reductase n=1 Tax=Hymenobacter sp. PAMC 26628 TaxID=1484118 RepID=UPI000A934D3C|nr:aldo/keto reductase [Hymenobacter sp. PAMC 26628]
MEAGGNFLDTADVYAGGRSEELLGRYIAERHLRDQLVLATKFGFCAQPGNPHAGGNGRKHINQALEGSLRRLNTDYIDLYWLHVWDTVTPAEEVLQTLGDLVRAGKIRYFGFSDMPAWYVTKAATLAHAHGVHGPIAMQLEYSLVARRIENEYVPAAQDLGLGITPWSPLAAGFLAGKYAKAGVGAASGSGRLMGPNPFGNMKFTDKNWQILEALRSVAAQQGQPLAQVALAWASAQPGITSLIVGASRLEQLQSNLASRDVHRSPEQLRSLDEASIEDPFYDRMWSLIKGPVFGGAQVQGWR